MGISIRGLAPALLAAGALAASGCATGTGAAASAAADGTATARAGVGAPDPASPPSPYPSSYRRRPSPPVLIRHATVLTAAGPRLEGASVLLRDGKIAAVGTSAVRPALFFERV